MAHPDQLSLLLVEDNPADVYLVRHAMRQEGLTVALDLAEDGEAAVAILDQVDSGTVRPAPDVILLDMNIPRMDGKDVLQRIRSSPRCSRTPVVMITSSDSPEERRLAAELGATEYFRKPSTLEEFLQLGKVIRRVHGAACA
jgi:CheY-like chemotaxis protein